MAAKQEDVNRALTAYHLAVAAAEYADSLKFQMEQVEGDNYCMVWSEANSGTFPPVNE